MLKLVNANVIRIMHPFIAMAFNDVKMICTQIVWEELVQDDFFPVVRDLTYNEYD